MVICYYKIMIGLVEPWGKKIWFFDAKARITKAFDEFFCIIKLVLGYIKPQGEKIYICNLVICKCFSWWLWTCTNVVVGFAILQNKLVDFDLHSLGNCIAFWWDVWMYKCKCWVCKNNKWWFLGYIFCSL
jgi:hypothetical protein